jgi:hypothetical protein
MFHRYICFSLFSTAFLLGSTSLTFAMEEPLEESKTCKALIPYQSPQEVLWPSQPRKKTSSIAQEDRDYFKLIESLKNPIPQTNSDLDEIQPRLKAPLVAELSLGKYLYLKGQLEDPSNVNPTLFVGVLDNGTKVFMKKSIEVTTDSGKTYTRYVMNDAIPELVAPRFARAYFDAPTLPPTELIPGKNGQCELRQYFIDDALPESIKTTRLEKLASMLYLHPELFGRPVGFIDLPILEELFLFNADTRSENNINKQIQKIRHLLYEGTQRFGLPVYFKGPLSLGDGFIRAADRNVTNFLWVPPCQSKPKWTFLAIDYEETTYHFNPKDGCIEKYDSDSDSDDENEREAGEKSQPREKTKYIAPLSALRKLDYLSKIYRSFFKEAENFAPDYYDDHCFAAMANWQNDLLTSFQGRAIDDLNYGFSTFVQSHKFTILGLKNLLPNLIRGLPIFKNLRKAQSLPSQD